MTGRLDEIAARIDGTRARNAEAQIDAADRYAAIVSDALGHLAHQLRPTAKT